MGTRNVYIVVSEDRVLYITLHKRKDDGEFYANVAEATDVIRPAEAQWVLKLICKGAIN